jgi:endonuclease-3
MSRGIYTLLFEIPDPVDIDVGALGSHTLSAGTYAYTGSALGRGGFARVDRHRRLAAGESDTRHWHVDHLLGHPDTALVTVVTSAGVDAECAVAGRLPRGPIAGFGASDCDCRSHLSGGGDGSLLTAVESAHRSVRES